MRGHRSANVLIGDAADVRAKVRTRRLLVRATRRHRRRQTFHCCAAVIFNIRSGAHNGPPPGVIDLAVSNYVKRAASRLPVRAPTSLGPGIGRDARGNQRAPFGVGSCRALAFVSGRRVPADRMNGYKLAGTGGQGRLLFLSPRNARRVRARHDARWRA